MNQAQQIMESLGEAKVVVEISRNRTSGKVSASARSHDWDDKQRASAQKMGWSVSSNTVTAPLEDEDKLIKWAKKQGMKVL